MAGTYNELINENPDLIRKGLELAIFVAPTTSEEEIENLMTSDGELNIPEQYFHVGLIEKDQGASWDSDVDNSDVESVGHVEPTRRDIIQDVTGLEFTMQESKLSVMGLYSGMDLSGVEAEDAGETHKNLTWDKPSRPAPRRHRVLALAKDGEGDDAVYFAKWLPNAQVTDKSEQEWGEDTEVQYTVTMTAFLDREFGTSMREMWAVPTHIAEAMLEDLASESDSGGGSDD